MANNINFGGGNGGGGSSTLSGLSDVTLTTPTSGQVLKFDGSKWVNGTGGGSSGHDYSSTEQVIGTWIDGKTLYEKTISFTTASTSGYTQQDLGLSSSDIDTIFVQSGFVAKGDNVATWGAYASSVNPEQCIGFLYRNSTNISFDYRVGSAYFAGSSSLTVRYTKTSA